MPSARAIRRAAFVLIGLAAAACASIAVEPVDYARMPRAIRIGTAEMAIAGVEQDVSRDEVAEAVAQLVEQAPVCMAWPGVWLEASDRRNVFLVRYDLMTRDWGAEVAAASRQRMRDFVDLGFLDVRERSDVGAGALEYTLTAAGSAHLVGTPYGGDQRPSFCASGGRRLVDVVSMEWGQYACGNLRVRFSHAGESWPDWARTENARARIAEAFGAAGMLGEGSVSLSRQWFRQQSLPSGVRNGALRSVCYDQQHARIVGDDLELRAGTSPQP